MVLEVATKGVDVVDLSVEETSVVAAAARMDRVTMAEVTASAEDEVPVLGEAEAEEAGGSEVVGAAPLQGKYCFNAFNIKVIVKKRGEKGGTLHHARATRIARCISI